MQNHKTAHNPYSIVRLFEEEIARYTGATFAISVDSCTNALFLCCKYYDIVGKEVTIPKKTYLSVPMSIIHAEGKVVFEDRNWSGVYQLSPYPIYDAAKRLTSDMYKPGTAMCLSFHIQKQLPIGKGGMILTDSYELVTWAKKARYEGRSEVNYKEDSIDTIGWNMYMTPQQAAHGLALIQSYPKHTEDLGEDGEYRDLTEFQVFRDCKCI